MNMDTDSAERFNALGRGRLPELVGLEIDSVTADCVIGKLPIRPELLAPNGFLHAASVIALADTACGYGSLNRLPDGASGFTTIELKSNFLGTAREGTLHCEARPHHVGRSTQVWDATVTSEASGKALALFRCTQMVLWPRS